MQEVRKIKVDFDRQGLHAAIESATRRKCIPSDCFGKDLIRGTIIGLIEHPDYSMELAIEKAARNCRINGSNIDLKRAVFEMAECYLSSDLLTDERGEEINDLEHIIEMWYMKRDHDLAYHKALKFVTEVTEGLIYDIQKSFCYSTTIEYLVQKGFHLSDLTTDVLKNMVFKKLVADDSTSECMYEYAYRKSLWSDEIADNKKIEETIDDYCSEILPEDCKSMFEFASRIVEEIYSCKGVSPN